MENYLKAHLSAEWPERTERAQSLARLLGQSERVNEIVKRSAEELSSLNAAIKQAFARTGPLPEIENALKKSEAVKNHVQEAAEKLAAVNRALEGEVRERIMVDHQLAAALEQEEAARDAAFHDDLTGLANRALFNDRLEHGIAQATRGGWTLAVMFIDLDNFKTINDTHGHDAGDAALRTTAQRLKENTRSVDTVGRHGGDEFLYLLTEIRKKKDIKKIAEKIIKQLQAPCSISVSNRNVDLSIEASIGISIFGKDGATADELIKSADEAMYRAKQSKSRYSFAR